MLPLLLACSLSSDDVRSAKPGDTADDPTFTLGDDPAEDSGSEDSGSEDSDTGAQDSAAPEDTARPAQACWLGPSRDDSACVPTVPFDASAFGSAYAYPPPYGGSAQYAAPDRFVDLEAVDLSMAVAPNFAMSEFLAPEKGRWGVLQAGLVEDLQALRDLLGVPVRVTSGYRSPGWNEGVGGVTYSRHQYGDAVDLDVASLSVEALGEQCEAIGASYVGLYEDGHTHCDWRDDPLDAAFYAPSRAFPAPPSPTARLRLDAVGVLTAPAGGFDEGEPLRRWWAWDADGNLLESVTGRSYAPPPAAVRVRVRVGGQVELETER
jgi:hypothetical protein